LLEALSENFGVSRPKKEEEKEKKKKTIIK